MEINEADSSRSVGYQLKYVTLISSQLRRCLITFDIFLEIFPTNFHWGRDGLWTAVCVRLPSGACTITRFLYRVGFYLTILLTILLCHSLLATSYLSIISQATLYQYTFRYNLGRVQGPQ